jgi:hypothetical protein
MPLDFEILMLGALIIAVILLATYGFTARRPAR